MRSPFLMLVVSCLTAIALQTTSVMAQEDESAIVSAGPWRSGFSYSIYTPHYGGQIPEVKRDRNFDDGPLALDGHVHERGFGCRGYSIIELDVPPWATTFAARVGIDDQDTGSGNGTFFSLWGDGTELWRSPALVREDPTIVVNVGVGGLRVLKLITDAQGYGNRDLADWCEPQWLRAAPPPGPIWRYVKNHGRQVRPELHPFNLAYRGEALPITVLAPATGEATLDISLTDDAGRPVLETQQAVSLAASEHANAQGTAQLNLDSLPNGLYDLRVSVLADGKAMAEREVRFGLIESRLGKHSQGTIFGVNHHEFISSYEPLAAIGCEYSRQWFVWSWIEPRKGEWSWSWHDERMAEARRFGIKTIGVLGGLASPGWSSPENLEAGKTTTHGCPADMADWEEYVRAVATRYKGQITVWESWNEIMGPARSNRLGWSIAKYVDLHRRTYRILKEIDPANKVLLSADWLSFVGECLDAGLGDTFDGIVPHPYRPGNSPEAWSVNYAVQEMGNVGTVFETARKWLTAHGHPRAEVWATEIGWAVSGNWATIPVSTHGEYVPRSYQLAQASGQAANLSWHDFAHGMFGLADPTGVPRPALLAYAAMVPRLTGAELVERLPLGGKLQGLRFRRKDTDLLTLCAESGTDFAYLKPKQAMRAQAYDWFGNQTSLHLPANGRALTVTGRIRYIEAPSLDGLEVTQRELVALTPTEMEVGAGQALEMTCSLSNDFGAAGTFLVRPEAADGLRFAEPVHEVQLGRGERRDLRLRATVARDATAGPREVPVTVTVPGGEEVSLRAFVRILPALTLTVREFDVTRVAQGAVTARVDVASAQGAVPNGTVTINAPDGITVQPPTATFETLDEGTARTLSFSLEADRPIVSADVLTIRAISSDSSHAERTLTLSPTVIDEDGDGIADGWRLNPEGGPPDRRNLATGSIEPGDSEFHCQRITCERFGGGWIILHRDGQDTIVKGKRYRASVRARSQGLKGLVGLAVYNITPWESCGLHKEQRLAHDWQTITHEFTATRDSDDVRFEVFFMSEGTLWVEALRLEELP